MALTIEQMQEAATKNLNECEQRLTELRAERDRLNDSIRLTVAQRDEAKSIVNKLTPRKRKAKPVAKEPVDDEAPE